MSALHHVRMPRSTAPCATAMQCTSATGSCMLRKHAACSHAAQASSKVCSAAVRQPVTVPHAAICNSSSIEGLSRRTLLLSSALLLPQGALAPKGTAAEPSSAQAALDSLMARPGSLLDRATTLGDVRSPGNSIWSKPGFLEFPRWLFGEWDVVSTFTGFRMPLGARFVDPALIRAAQAPTEEGGIGTITRYKQRWYSTLPDTTSNQIKFMLGTGIPDDAIVADRAFNTKSMSNAILGTDAIMSVEYSLRDAPDRQTVEFARIAPDMRPLPPRKAELYINNTQSEVLDISTFIAAELFRQVMLGVRAVDVNDYEVLTVYHQVAPGRLKGTQRSVVYLEPRDQLYFQASGRAVAVYDYQFEAQRTPPPEDAPRDAVACVLTPKDVNQCV